MSTEVDEDERTARRRAERQGRRLLLCCLLMVLTFPVALAIVWVQGAREHGESARLGAARIGHGSVVHPVSPGTVVAARQWPGACGLLDEADITAVLPDAREIDSFPGGSSTRTIERFAVNPEWEEGDYAPEGRCTWHLELPGERVNSYTEITVTIVAVADADLVRRYHDKQVLGRGSGIDPRELEGGGSCYPASLYQARLVCARGPLMFEVEGSTTTDFGDYRGFSFLRDHVMPEFARSVASKVDAG
jgi:hypothetical protein